MKLYERESLIKNFIVFFSLLELLLILLFLQIYHNSKEEYNKELLHKMQLCSYFLKCKEFKIGFVPLKTKDLNRLYFEKDSVNGYFYIPKSKKYNMTLSYSIEEYNRDIHNIFINILYKFILFSTLLFFVAIIFTLYSLNPIRRAIRINDEFIKDILHDFNTPIASMVLNIEMFSDENGKNIYIKKLSQSINTILLLQENLKTFLHNSPSQVNLVDINILAKERLNIISSIYPNINYKYLEISSFKTYTNPELLTRIFDNLLSNAFKYNRQNGLVTLTVDKYRVIIEDNGRGIKDIKKITQRYYKENSRGIGLGLHIVEKLTQELNIKFDIKSEANIGTKIVLYFDKKDIGYDSVNI